MDYSYLIGLLVLVLIFAFAKKGNNSLNSPMTTLVLTKFQMMESDDSDELLYISGRQSGLIGWLLVKLGLGAETTIQVNKKELLIKKFKFIRRISFHYDLKEYSKFSLWVL